MGKEFEGIEIEKYVKESIDHELSTKTAFIFFLIVFYLLFDVYFGNGGSYNLLLVFSIVLSTIFIWVFDFWGGKMTKDRCKKLTSLNKEEFNEKWDEIKKELKNNS